MGSNISHDTDVTGVNDSVVSDTSLTLTGSVASGMGKAKEFLSLPGYVAQFNQRLGFEPYPGTLNVTLTGDMDSRLRIKTFDSIRIESWELDGQTFGGAECYPCDIKNQHNESYDTAYVLIPDRTDHSDDKIEIIAPPRLRDILDLEDGDELVITLSQRS